MTTLSTADEHVLAQVAGEAITVEALAADLDREEGALRDRLEHLEAAGLVETLEGETITLTPSGRRVLSDTDRVSSGEFETVAERVADALDGVDLRADRRAAVGAAAQFLAFWGDATAAEVTEALFWERPAGFATPTDWWDACVREHLAALDAIESPPGELRWRHTGQAMEGHPSDGRHVSGAYGSVRHAVEHLSLTNSETLAVRAAFDYLFFHRPADRTAIVAARFEDYPAGYESAGQWWDECIGQALRELPGVAEVGTDDVWDYSRETPAAHPPSDPSTEDDASGED